MRDVLGGGLVDADLAAVAVAHLATRAAYLRSSFSQLAQKLIAKFSDALGDQTQFRELLEIDSCEPHSQLAAEIARALDGLGAASLPKKERLHLERLIRFRVREKFDLSALSLGPAIQEELAAAHISFPKMVAEGHTGVLEKSLAPSNRVDALKRLQWRVISMPPPARALLPDCVAIAADHSGEMHPYAMRSPDEVTLVAMPVSSTQVLVGSVSEEIPSLLELNISFAKCSLEFFVSSNKGSEVEALQALIGEVTKNIMDEFVDGTLPSQLSPSLPAPSPRRRPAKALRVEFAPPADKNAKRIKAIQDIFTEQCSDREIDRIYSILIARDVASEVARHYGRPLTEYESSTVAIGTVEIVATPAKPALQIIVPTHIVQRLFASDANVSKAAAKLIRHHIGRANYFDIWLTRVAPVLQGRMFTFRERLILELTQKFLANYYGVRTAAPELSMTDLHPGEPVSAHAISNALTTVEAMRHHFLEHREVDTLLANVLPALDVLLGTVAIYCGLRSGQPIGLAPTSLIGRTIAAAGLWDWLVLFDRDLRHHIELIDQSAPTLSEMLSLAEHAERVLWQFGIFLSDSDGGQIWVLVSDEDGLHRVRQVLSA